MPKLLKDMLKLTEQDTIGPEQLDEMQRSMLVVDLTEIEKTWGDTYLHIALKNKTHPALFLMLLKTLSERKQLEKICHTTNHNGMTPWHLAYQNQLTEQADYIAEYLAGDAAFVSWITNFVDEKVKTQEPEEWPRFTAATDSADGKQIKMLVKALGAKATLVATTLCFPNTNCFPLHFAARYGDITTVQTLLTILGNQAATMIATPITSTGWTPLYIAAISRHDYSPTEILQAMINILGVDQAKTVIATPVSDGRTSLHAAVEYGDAAMVQVLLNALGDQAARVVAMQANDGSTPLTLIKRNSNHRIQIEQVFIAEGHLQPKLKSQSQFNLLNGVRTLANKVLATKSNSPMEMNSCVDDDDHDDDEMSGSIKPKTPSIAAKLIN